MTEVVAALIWDKDRFLICQRPANKARGLLWEFVGGKVEPGETPERALVRECSEELGITVSPERVFMDVVHEYPDLTVHLTLFSAVIAEGVPQLLEHNDLRWITAAETDDYPFCPADEQILAALKKVKRYHKLVRDRIPEIIAASGGDCVTSVLSDADYLAMLDKKLREELEEYLGGGDIEELADLVEVAFACAKARGASAEELERIRAEKAAERGAFERRLLLEKVREG